MTSIFAKPCLMACSYGLSRFVRTRAVGFAASNRLAFRELGPSDRSEGGIGYCSQNLRNAAVIFEKRDDLRRAINLLQRHVPMGDEIVGAWLPHAEWQDKSWRRTSGHK